MVFKKKEEDCQVIQDFTIIMVKLISVRKKVPDLGVGTVQTEYNNIWNKFG